MLIELDLRSRKPIYEQICDRIKEMIAIGDLQDGDQLPAVRVLAKDIGINHNTIQKAFAQLERDGVIVSVGGKGSFVHAGEQNSNRFKKQALEEIKAEIAKNLIYNITRQDIDKISEEIFSSSDPAKGAAY